ncbi:class I adenylate-forming enzyme family protein [Chloroflexota bacterium]
MSKGCKVVLLERFGAEEALKLIEQEKVTFATGVPAQLVMMVKHPNFSKYDLSSLRAFYYAGAHLPYTVAEEVEQKMGCRIVAQYGNMETGFSCTTCFDDPPEVRRESVGRPLRPKDQLKLVDERGLEVPRGKVGELIIKESRTSFHYYKETKLNHNTIEPDGWYHLGDLGKFDNKGNLYIVGRKKDMIIRGGRNIFPAEIESILITYPKVVNATVVGMPDPVMGEKACAFVILKTGSTLIFDEMVAFLNGKGLAKYKLPERLEIVDSFPMSGDGQKVLKRVLIEKITGQLKAEKVIS